MRSSIYPRRLKRLMDVTLAALALVVLGPLMIAVAAAILLDDGGPVMFRQTRVGKDGRTFCFLKFRSMTSDTAEVPSAAAGDLQVTRVGRIIRRGSLDELPQLLNILRGDMSIVGPRPAIPAQHKLIDLRRESGALSCHPGLTGLAQVNSYDGMPEKEKAAWDSEYARRLSFLMDLSILAKTIAYLSKPPPTY